MLLKRFREKGFSLAELGIALVIMLILTTVATIGYFVFIDDAKEVTVVENSKRIQEELAREYATDNSAYQHYAEENPISYEKDIKTEVKEVLEYHFNQGTNLLGVVFTNDPITKNGEVIIGELRMNKNVAFDFFQQTFLPTVKASSDVVLEGLEIRKLDNNKLSKILQEQVTGDWYVIDKVRTKQVVNNDNNSNDEESNVEESTDASCFEFDKTTGTITQYLCEEKDVVIPSEIDGVTVVAIGTYELEHEGEIVTIGAFVGKDLNSVQLPNTITYIGKQAFLFNNLTSIELPNGLIVIDDWAFSQNQLDSVVIPDSVTNIGMGAFDNNQLTEVILSNNLEVIKRQTFSKNNLSTIEFPNSLRKIDDMAFLDNNFTEIVIPDGVKEIGEWVFMTVKESQLLSVTIPKSVTSIKYPTFRFISSPTMKTIIYGYKDSEAERYASSIEGNFEFVTLD